MIDFTPGDKGHFVFRQWPKGVEAKRDFYGTVVKVYPGFVLIEDNENNPYLVLKSDLKFEKSA